MNKLIQDLAETVADAIQEQALDNDRLVIIDEEGNCYEPTHVSSDGNMQIVWLRVAKIKKMQPTS